MPSKVPLQSALVQNTVDLNNKSILNADYAQVFPVVALAGSTASFQSSYKGCHLRANHAVQFIINLNDSDLQNGDTFLISNTLGYVTLNGVTTYGSPLATSPDPGFISQIIKIDTNFFARIIF